MIEEGNGMRLKTVNEVFHGQVNDVSVCSDFGKGNKAFYFLWVVKEHTAAKKILEAVHAFGQEEVPYLECFSDGENLCFLFPYEEERPLSRFYQGQQMLFLEALEVCVKVVEECMICGLPPSLLYLFLEQQKIQIRRDRSIYFSYVLDLKEFDTQKSEKDCVLSCARLLEGLLTKTRAKEKSLELIRKKMKREQYGSFPELYHDLKIMGTSLGRVSFNRGLLKEFYIKNHDRIFKVLLAISGALLFAVIIMLISQLLFGGIPLLRLFSNSFEQIGTESLLQ